MPTNLLLSGTLLDPTGVNPGFGFDKIGTGRLILTGSNTFTFDQNTGPFYGVRVNALSPGMVKTDLNESVWQAGQVGRPAAERQDYESWAAEKIRKVSPLGQWQTPPEFAAMAVFLASDHARNITGQTINIDGGQVMHA